MNIVACFEPFAGRRKNRSERAVRRLRGTPGVELMTLPVSFAKLPAALVALFAKNPETVVLCGESRRAERMRIERIALNLADASLPDNDGALLRGAALDAHGPLAREVRFDPARIVAALEAAHIPAATSAHAGTFCCNAALYLALGMAHTATVAFVHVPAEKRYLGASAAAHGLRIVLAALATRQTT